MAATTVLDSEASQVGALYARALLGAARDQVDEVLAELQALVTECLDRFPAFDELLKSPRLTAEEKEAVLQRVFEGRTSPLLLNFLKVLCRRNRIGYLRDIERAATELREEQLGKVRVTVRTPQPLTPEQREQLEKAFAEAYGKQPVLLEEVDPRLLGGLTLRVGDEVIDGSVVGLFDAMQRSVCQGVERLVRDRYTALVSS